MRRTTILISVAALAPVLVLAATTGAAGFRDQVRESEAEHLAVAREVNARLDGELMAQSSALAVFATSAVIASHDWPHARQRAIDIMADRPDWRDVFLTDARSHKELWAVRQEGTPQPARPGVLSYLHAPSDRARVGDLGGAAAGCPCLTLHQPIYDASGLRYVLSAEIAVDTAKRILDRDVRPPDVGAVIDRSGRFIARTLLHAERVGHPASRYVLATLRGPGSGVYDGVTLEGLSNRTVYERSPVTGFATHIALPRDRFELLGAGSFALRLAALLLSLIVAGLGVGYALREQRRWRVAEQQRTQAQKLEAIGRFASGVAHDFNNLLTVMIGRLDVLDKRLGDATDRRHLDQARAAAAQGADLVQQLLGFAREQPPELEALVLTEVLDKIEPLLREAVPSVVRVTIEPAQVHPTVLTNRLQLESALINLARNSADAMPDGGTLTFQIRPARNSDWVDLIVSDSGKGMPPEVLQRALDPFFTTKPAGKGTGLGLAQIHALMLQSSGKIEIDSQPGKGTRVTLRFPVERTG